MINIKRLHPDATIPSRKHDGDSGADLTYPGPEEIMIHPGRTVMIPTGISIALEHGTEGQIRPRSSISRRGLLVHLGTIDSEYRGEVGVIITNLGEIHQHINPGDRIAQLVVAPVLYPKFREVEELSKTERGDGGFGSTGR